MLPLAGQSGHFVVRPRMGGSLPRPEWRSAARPSAPSFGLTSCHGLPCAVWDRSADRAMLRDETTPRAETRQTFYRARFAGPAWPRSGPSGADPRQTVSVHVSPARPTDCEANANP